MADILLNILSKVGECSVGPTIRQVNYLFHFKGIVKDLKKECENLGLKQDRVKHDVSMAEQNAEAIEKDVRKWLSNVEGVMKEVQNAEEKIQANKRCLCGWCPNMIWRYNLGKDAMKKTTTIRKLQEDGKFDRVSYRTRTEFIPSQQITAFESTESALNQIIEALKDDECNMIGLHGTGGVGKTTLAKEVGKRAKELKLVDNVLIAVVSQNPNFTKIQETIAEWIGLKLEEKSKEVRTSRLFSRLMNEKMILIILDDVWDYINLAEDIGIPSHKECKILLTTRRLQVCNVMGSDKNIPMNALSEKEAWALFKKSSGLDDNSPTLNDVAMEVVGECKGLPLAIVAVGSALKGKTLDEYKQASKQLKRSRLVDIEDVHNDKQVYPSLKLSYDYLKREKTKLCFLLCSLFPEDYEIDIEELFRYGMGVDLFKDIDSIEDARSQLRVMINNLKDSSLLLEASDKRSVKVKMHDVVRDVALWIASEGENVFMVRARAGLTEWPNEETFEQYTAISLMSNKIKVLPSKLECPRLKILLLGGDSVTISDAFFEEMKALKVLKIYDGILSSQSLQFLTNLQTLDLEDCKFDDISSLGKLKKLEILKLNGSTIVELPNEIGELNNLRLLELNCCRELMRIPPNVISKLSKLEELYTGGGNRIEWEVKAPDEERSGASLWELNSLSHLAVLSMRFDAKDLPIRFAFPKLQRYNIDMQREFIKHYPTSRTLILEDIDATSLNAFKELFPTVEYLGLVSAAGFQNIIPNMDQGGLNDLISLHLNSCNEMECLIDSTQQHVPTTAFSNLVNLSLHVMAHLREIWKCPTQDGEILTEAHIQPLCFSKLTTLQIRNCKKLEYIFPISIAQRLRQLEKLQILDCPQLKQVFSYGKEDDGNDIVLPKLREIQLRGLSSLTGLSEGNYHWMWPSLQKLTVAKCPKLTISFITDLEAKLRTLEKQLRILWIGNYSLLHTALSLILKQSLQNLEELTIDNCEGVQELFNGISSVSNLKKLNLKDLPELRVIWKGPTQTSSFRNLTKIDVTNCKKLTHIFSPSLARNLPQLESLNIVGCEELERIIGEEDKDGEDQIISFKGHLQQLKRIWVFNCNKLKSLLPITIAQGLPQLNTLHIESAFQLEEVFSHENEEDVRDEKKIVLPQLSWLNLLNLPKLISFCQGRYHFIFPSLEILNVQDCIKITTSFTIASDGPVHAKDKAKAEKSYVVDESDEDEGIKGAEVKVEEEEEEVKQDEIIESDIKLEKPDNASPQKKRYVEHESDKDKDIEGAEVKVEEEEKEVEVDKIVKSDIDMPEGSSTTQSTYATRPNDSNIDWFRGGNGTLPPYMEELSGNL